ncbi:MAG: MBL fold metallo-hydrolase [Acidobacteriota bacterium]
MKKDMFVVTFWGVRGSRPVPGPDTLIYGGNTPCIQVQVAERLCIIDAGTGICNLGQELIKSGEPVKGDIFITHTHWDHIQGFPFFAPAFIPANHFVLYGQGKMNNTFANLMRGQMEHPHFPVTIDQMDAQIEFKEIDAGDELDLGEGIIIQTIHNNHPNGCLSYRINYNGRSCCCIFDTEHYSVVDPNLKRFAQNADVIIYDCNFTDEEYEGKDGAASKVGYGHSTWQQGIKLVKACNAKKLVLFHHSMYRTDKEMAKIEAQARKAYPDSIAAREGMSIEI